jgi:UDP-N-acetyl-2-amino-2-deoxyglucuronate dehydrogenase
VFTEKPFGHSLASCRRMIAALEAEGLRGWVGAQRKYHAHFQEARRVLASMDVDFVSLAFTYFWGPAYTGPGWRGERAKSGGVAVIDSGWHALDALSWFLGDPTDVFCQLTCLDGHPDIDDTAALQLRYRSGACGSIVISYTQPKSRMDFTFCCGHQTVYLGYDGLQLYDGPDEVRQVEAIPHEAVFPAMYDELAKAYRGDSSAFVTDMRRAEGIMQVVDAAYCSAESADVVHLPQSPPE